MASSSSHQRETQVQADSGSVARDQSLWNGRLDLISDNDLLSILREPSKYPLDWVVAASLKQSQRSKEPSLAEASEASQWFQ
jgi:hypothetical protein